jgi:alpha-tubulin suppressor-like RCC1 family protein
MDLREVQQREAKLIPDFQPISSLKHVTKVAFGSSHALALTNEGSLFAWGWNGYGNLGTPD